MQVLAYRQVSLLCCSSMTSKLFLSMHASLAAVHAIAAQEQTPLPLHRPGCTSHDSIARGCCRCILSCCIKARQAVCCIVAGADRQRQSSPQCPSWTSPQGTAEGCQRCPSACSPLPGRMLQHHVSISINSSVGSMLLANTVGMWLRQWSSNQMLWCACTTVLRILEGTLPAARSMKSWAVVCLGMPCPSAAAHASDTMLMNLQEIGGQTFLRTLLLCACV